MKRSYPSGSEKKKKKQAKQIENERGKGILDGFLQSTSKKGPTLISEVDPQKSLQLQLGHINAEGTETNKKEESFIVNTDFHAVGTNELNSEKNKEEIQEYCQGLDADDIPRCSNDPASWKDLHSKKRQRDLIILKGPPSKPENIPRDSCGRNFPSSIFKKKLTNGESVERDWMVWSLQNAAFFCFPCCLFKNDSQTYYSKFIQDGIDGNWKKIYEKVKSHESNTDHLNHYIRWKELFQTLIGDRAAIDQALIKQIKEEEEKWRKILSAVIDVVLFLTENNLPFRGSHSTLDKDDCGVFLSTVKLVGKHSPELNQHLKIVTELREKGRRMQAHYLSWRTQNEFLKLCGEKTVKAILAEVRFSKYYSIIVDGTPDVSHKEQLVFILRYVFQRNRKWNVHEKFIKLVDFEYKTGAAVAEQIKMFLKECELELSWCRGQGYDNASNMSGKFKGVKTRILEENPQAYFSPCGAHTLNLCGTHAMETSAEIKSFFGNVQKLYNVFALSPMRWKILQNTTKISLHAISKTRWSSRIDAIRPLLKNYQGILEALTKVEEELNLPADIQADIDGLLAWLNSFEFVLLAILWFKVLTCIDDRNKVLQSAKLTVGEGAKTVQSLVAELDTIRGAWLNIFEEAKLVASNLGIEPEFKIRSRIRKRKRFFDDLGDIGFKFDSPVDRFKIEVFLPALDLLLTEIRHLAERMSEVSRLFSPIISPLDEHSVTLIEDYAHALVTAYPKDLQKVDLSEELRIFYKLKKEEIICAGGHTDSALDLLNAIFEKGLETVLPQICICLRLFAALPVTVATGERAFSKLALIKNRLRSTISEERLNHLLTLSIEHEMLKEMNFDDIITEFAQMKSRKIKI